MRNLGNIAARENRTVEAQDFYQEGLNKAEGANLDHLAYEIRYSIGILLSQKLKEYHKARIQFEMAKEYFQKVGDDICYSAAIFGLASNESLQGKSNNAKRLFNECLNLTKKIGRRDLLATILWFLAKEEEKSNNILSALKYIKESNESFERLELKHEYELTKKLIESLEKKIN